MMLPRPEPLIRNPGIPWAQAFAWLCLRRDYGPCIEKHALVFHQVAEADCDWGACADCGLYIALDERLWMVN